MDKDTVIGKPQKEEPKWQALLTGNLAHFIHDGFTDMLYLFFPLWQAQWALTFTEVGLLKTVVSGSMAMFQLPVGIVANRIGQVKLLLIGTVITSLAIMLWGLAVSPILLGLLLLLGGLGSSVQHPVSSSIISDAYSYIRARRTALSTIMSPAISEKRSCLLRQLFSSPIAAGKRQAVCSQHSAYWPRRYFSLAILASAGLVLARRKKRTNRPQGLYCWGGTAIRPSGLWRRSEQ